MGKWASERVAGKITALRMEGRSHRYISKVLKIPKSTVCDVAKRKDNPTKKGKGRPHKLTPRDKRALIRALEKDPRATPLVFGGSKKKSGIEKLKLGCKGANRQT